MPIGASHADEGKIEMNMAGEPMNGNDCFDHLDFFIGEKALARTTTH